MANPSHITRCGFPGIDGVPSGCTRASLMATATSSFAAVAPYFVAGLLENEPCIWIAAPPLPAREAARALRATWDDVDDAIDAIQEGALSHTQLGAV